jgi:hypothetical protein
MPQLDATKVALNNENLAATFSGRLTIPIAGAALQRNPTNLALFLTGPPVATSFVKQAAPANDSTRGLSVRVKQTIRANQRTKHRAA